MKNIKSFVATGSAVNGFELLSPGYPASAGKTAPVPVAECWLCDEDGLLTCSVPSLLPTCPAEG